MINRELITDRLSRIREYLKHLRELGSLPKEEFVHNFVNHSSAARILHIAIEAALDIGHHVISRKELRRPKDYKDIFVILGEAKLLTPELSKSLAGMAQYRNRLVHLYWDITPGELYDILQGPVDDLETYMNQVIESLDM